MKIEITEYREYELLVKKQIKETTLTNKQQGIVRKLVMQVFADGRTFERDGKLEHETDV